MGFPANAGIETFLAGILFRVILFPTSHGGIENFTLPSLLAFIMFPAYAGIENVNLTTLNELNDVSLSPGNWNEILSNYSEGTLFLAYAGIETSLQGAYHLVLQYFPLMRELKRLVYRRIY
jgi:hypothetical protein